MTNWKRWLESQYLFELKAHLVQTCRQMLLLTNVKKHLQIVNRGRLMNHDTLLSLNSEMRSPFFAALANVLSSIFPLRSFWKCGSKYKSLYKRHDIIISPKLRVIYLRSVLLCFVFFSFVLRGNPSRTQLTDIIIRHWSQRENAT